MSNIFSGEGFNYSQRELDWLSFLYQADPNWLALLPSPQGTDLWKCGFNVELMHVIDKFDNFCVPEVALHMWCVSFMICNGTPLICCPRYTEWYHSMLTLEFTKLNAPEGAYFLPINLPFVTKIIIGKHEPAIFIGQYFHNEWIWVLYNVIQVTPYQDRLQNSMNAVKEFMSKRILKQFETNTHIIISTLKELQEDRGFGVMN